jgi:Mn-dependent DtxR family transcriptional regulator
MPKPYGTTMKGKAEAWLRQNADGRMIKTNEVAAELGISRVSVLNALKHLMANNSISVTRYGTRRTTWWIGPRKGGT